MRWIDYVLQSWRSGVAARYVCRSDALLDVGCYDGAFVQMMQTRTASAVGVDRAMPDRVKPEALRSLVVADVTEGLPFPSASFDVVTLLAVFEHLQNGQVAAREVDRVLRPGGRLVLTVPGQHVDTLLRVLITLRLADGMSLAEHHGHDARTTPAWFAEHGFVLVGARQFQLGMNNLFVFRKP